MGKNIECPYPDCDRCPYSDCVITGFLPRQKKGPTSRKNYYKQYYLNNRQKLLARANRRYKEKKNEKV